MGKSTVQKLSLLPVDILCNIFRHLDPVGLIATSQSCRAFRNIIAPSSKHFAERLLALELEEAHGGVVPQFLARENRLTPPWEDELWEGMRWACTHCLRLLRHTSFDNRSLLRLRYRKPQPGSKAAVLYSGVTSWEPVERPALTAKAERQKRIAYLEDTQGDKALKAKYHCAVTKGLGLLDLTALSQETRIANWRQLGLDQLATFPHFDTNNLTDGQKIQILDSAAHWIEDVRTGSHRHARKCNECRFQLSEFKRTAFVISRFQNLGGPVQLTWGFNCNKGSMKVPIIRSRRWFYETPLDRHFPDLTAYTQSKRPDYQLLTFRIHRSGDRYYPATTYMARCPVCNTWQELRNFRREPQGWGYGEWIGIGSYMSEEQVTSYLKRTDVMCCNRCLAAEHGEQTLAQELLALFHIHTSYVGDQCLEMLQSGSRSLEQPNRCPKEYRGVLKQLSLSLERMGKKLKTHQPRGYPQFDLDAEDLEDNLKAMKGKHAEWLHLSKSMPEFVDELLSHSATEVFTVWHNEWDEMYGYWRWLAALRAEVREKPDILVAWALDQPFHRP